MISKSGKVLIIHLITSEEELSIKHLQKVMNLSSNSVIKELNQIEEYLLKFDIILRRLPSKGIWIECSNENRNRCLLNLNELPSTNDSKIETNYRIISLILDDSFESSHNNISRELFISRTGITNYLSGISKSISNDYNLELVKENRLFKILGKECDIRKMIVKIILESIDLTCLYKIVHDDLNQFSSTIKSKYLEIDGREFKMLFIKVMELETNLNFKFTDESIVNLIMYILVTVDRIKNSHQISLKVAQSSKYDDFYNKLEELYDISLDIDERGYLSGIISREHKLVISGFCNEELETTIRFAIHKAHNSEIFKLDNDEQLFEGIHTHLQASISRIKNQDVRVNPLTDDVKFKYKLSFQIAKDIYGIIQKKIYLPNIPDDEVALLALYIQASIERNKDINNDDIRVVIVCATGVATSQLVSAKLKNIFPDIKIIEILSVMEFYSRELDGIDFIISTVHLTPNVVIHVSPLLTDLDIGVLESCFGKLVLENSKQLNSTWTNYISLGTTILVDNFNDKNTLLRELCDVLERRGFITEEFYNSLLRREMLNSTRFKNISLPHANSKYILNTCILICKLSSPMKWDDKEISVIFILVIKDDEKNRGVVESLYEFIDFPDNINNIINSKSNKEVLRNIKGEKNDR